MQVSIESPYLSTWFITAATIFSSFDGTTPIPPIPKPQVYKVKYTHKSLSDVPLGAGATSFITSVS